MKVHLASWLAGSIALIALHSACAEPWIFSGPVPSPLAGVVSSADGSKLAALAYGSPWLFTSTNSGATWKSNSLPAEPWTSLASSADGVRLVAAANNCHVYTSTNAGATWTFRTELNGFDGCYVASSTDGTKLLAAALTYVADFGDFGRLYTSGNSGESWTPRLDDQLGLYGATFFSSVASSADGVHLAGVSAAFTSGMAGELLFPGCIFISLGNPSTWYQLPPYLNWTSVASSASGTNLIAVAASFHAGLETQPSAIYTSTNAGINWKSNTVPAAPWTSTASSADGAKLVAVASNGRIYTSTDFGGTWISNSAPALNWTSVASSADGTKLVAASSQGIYVSQPPPALSIAWLDGNLVLSWPPSALAFALQESSDLTSTDWIAVATSPVFTNGQYRVIVGPTNDSRFYRLKSF